MPTITFATGFELNWTSVAGGLPAASEALWEAVGGTKTITTGNFRNGASSLHLGAASGANYVSIQLGAGQTVVVGSIYVKWGSASYGEQVLAFSLYEGSGGVVIGQNADGNWFANVCTGTVSDTEGPACTTDWTRIDFRADVSNSSVWQLAWQVDGVTQTTNTRSSPGSTGSMDHFRFGDVLGPTTSWESWLDDVVLSYTSGDYPLGEYQVERFGTGSADGTHSNQSNFQDESNTAISAGNPAYPSLSITNVTLWVHQDGNGTGDYIEIPFGDSSVGTDPDAVTIHYRLGSEGNPSNDAQLRIREGGSETTLFSGDSSDTGTDNVFWKTLATKPSGGAWTESAWNSTVYRWGYSSDANPDPIIYGVLAEVAYPVSAGTTLTGTALSIPASLPTGKLRQSYTGTALSATPTLPTAKIEERFSGAVVTATPSLPAGAVHVSGIYGQALSATPTLPTGSLQQLYTGQVVTASPSLPAGDVKAALSGAVVTATPSLPTGKLAQYYTGQVVTITPSLPVGQITESSVQLDGVVVAATPTLPTGKLQQNYTGAVVSATPSLPVGEVLVGLGLSGQTVYATPTLPAGKLEQRYVGSVVTATPNLPVGEVLVGLTLPGQTVYATPTLPVGSMTVGLGLQGVSVSATPSLPIGKLEEYFAGTVVTATPSLPVGIIQQRYGGATVYATPTLPLGELSITGQIDGVVVTATPSLPSGSIQQRYTGTVITATPTLPTGSLVSYFAGQTVEALIALPTGSLQSRLTGTPVSLAPALPAGGFREELAGTPVSLAPALPAGGFREELAGQVVALSVSTPTGEVQTSVTLTGQVVTATPSLPVGGLLASYGGQVVTVSPTVPTGSIEQRYGGSVVTATPTLPTGGMQWSFAGTPVTMTPVLPVGSAGVPTVEILGTVLTVTPTLPTGNLTFIAVADDYVAGGDDSGVIVRDDAWEVIWRGLLDSGG